MLHSGSKGKDIEASVTNADGFSQVVLDDGNVLFGAFGAEQPATMPTMMLASRNGKSAPAFQAVVALYVKGKWEEGGGEGRSVVFSLHGRIDDIHKLDLNDIAYTDT